ncbi:MAG: PAS domain-containing protein [Candidatus Limnocylindrales bacterium]
MPRMPEGIGAHIRRRADPRASNPDQPHAVELILARQLASGLAVPVLLVDARGDTLFYNEPAEAIFGRAFDEIDALPFEQRAAMLAPRGSDGQPLPVEQLPGMLAMRERRPAHAEFYLHGLDGVLRAIEATAIPVESAGGHVLGTMVVMWEGHMAHPE